MARCAHWGAGARAESGIDGLASAAHTSTAPIMASPTAIKALTSRLAFQLDEPNISFDPLIDSARDRVSAQMRQRLWFCWSVPIVWVLRIWLQDRNASVQQSGGGDLGP